MQAASTVIRVTTPPPPAHSQPADVLLSLPAALDAAVFTATIVTGQGPPFLRVTNRRASWLTEDVYAGRGWFWWSWAERIATDPQTAASRLARVLREASPAGTRT